MQVILILLLSIAAACAGPVGLWVNELDKPFTYTCKNSQSISFIISEHSNKNKDRVWDFSCQNTFNKPSSCIWTYYVNDFDKEFTFTCPFGSVLTGTSSYHDNNTEDRRWKYYCCKGGVEVTRNCKWSGYVNDFEKYLRWETPTNNYLTGVHSYHDDIKNDRRWSYHYCQKN
ncbi:hemagglutinin/amebocyte aggregation factor-like [Mixophyes fleayi]|uniref:hemagglutinin/amebocyte aggregation factor-like n=1 Tax=Mixophyes fleayi TaxID=3061075 RepID=UPI003F4DDEF7